MEASCALCGVLMSEQSREQWIKEFRAVYTEHDEWGGIKLSGCIIISPMAHCDPVPFWGFGFHSVCWDLLTTLFQPNLSDLFYVCFSMRVDLDGILDWGHEYGGAVYRDRLRGSYPKLRRCGWSDSHSEGLGCDPYHVPAIQRFFHSSINLDDGGVEVPAISDKIRMDGDIFKRLPPETLQDILIRLSSKDVVNLRQSSPVFANLGLSETFWASRFRRGFEYHYIFESLKARPKSWKALYLSMRSLAPAIPNLVNRKRVWKLALQLESLLHQVSGIPCQGRPLKSYYEPAEAEDTLKWHTACRGIRTPSDSFTVGCRPLRTRVVNFDAGLTVRDLWVSFVRMNGGSFISGLRFVGADDQVISLGYIHHGQEVRVRFPDNRRECPYVISGRHLAIDLQGFRAIAVLDSDGALSSWVGEAEIIPRWCLAGPGQSISAIRAEFDALKLVSLSRDVTPDTKFDRGLLWRNSCLWSPDVPPDHVFLNGTNEDFPFRGFQNAPYPFSTIIFGGLQGELLPQLVEIVVHIFDVNKFTGFEFIYADTSKNESIGDIGPYPDDMTGTHTPSDYFRLSMIVDGPGGERVQDVKAHVGGGGFYGLKIRTNRGRELTCPPPLDFRDDELMSLELSGSMIVGFYMINKFPLRSLGVMSIDPGEGGEAT